MRSSFMLIFAGFVLVCAVLIFELRSKLMQPSAISNSAVPVSDNTSPLRDRSSTQEARSTGHLSEVNAPSTMRESEDAVDRAEREATFHQRLAEVNALGSDLPEAKIAELYEYLRDTRIGEYTIKNDVLTVLRKQNAHPELLTDVLIEMFRSASESAVMRDYVIQHASLWYGEVEGEVDRKRLEPIFWEALKQIDSTIAGTGLLALHRLSRDFPQLDATRIGREAGLLAENEKANVLSRTAALQVCAVFQLKEALPVCEQVARSGTSVPFRLAALFAVGELGSALHVELLEALISTEEEPVRIAATHARARLKQRLGV